MSTTYRSRSIVRVSPIATFTDNYVWLLHRDAGAVLIDPGEAAPVRAALTARALNLEAILITHHHPDHIGGIEELCDGANIPVIGPRAESAQIPMLTRKVGDGEAVSVLGTTARVIAVPGHTLGHIAFHFPKELLLFCGDTMFSAGCGRLFEGTAAQMHDSLTRLAALPSQTAVFCAHEYTASNLAFAQAVEPGNARLAEHRQHVQSLRAAGQPSLPSRIELERQINPFLRTASAEIRASVNAHTGQVLEEPVDIFAALRSWKDGFSAPSPV